MKFMERPCFLYSHSDVKIIVLVIHMTFKGNFALYILELEGHHYKRLPEKT